MTRRFLVMSMCAFVLATAAGSSRVAAQSPEEQVRQAERARFNAMVNADIAALDKLLAPELIYTHGDARRIDKAAFIADFKTGAFKYVSIDPKEINVRVYGDVAVVAGAAAMQIVNNGAPASIQIRYTNVQVRRNGVWQMVAWQATRMAQP